MILGLRHSPTKGRGDFVCVVGLSTQNILYLTAVNTEHFVFESFIFFSLEDEAEYRHSSKRMITNENYGRVHSELVYVLDGIEHT